MNETSGPSAATANLRSESLHARKQQCDRRLANARQTGRMRLRRSNRRMTGLRERMSRRAAKGTGARPNTCLQKSGHFSLIQTTIYKIIIN